MSSEKKEKSKKKLATTSANVGSADDDGGAAHQGEAQVANPSSMAKVAGEEWVDGMP